MYDIGPKSAVRDLSLYDVAGLSLLSKDGDRMVGNDQGIECVDLP